jgi:hypothetical protein
MLTAFELPTVDPAVISILRDNVEFGDPAREKEIALLLGWLQVQHARLRGLQAKIGGPVPSLEVLGRVIDAAAVSARASSLYDYARRLEEGRFIEVSADRLRTALFEVGIVSVDHDQLEPMIVRRTAAGQPNTGASISST